MHRLKLNHRHPARHISKKRGRWVAGGGIKETEGKKTKVTDDEEVDCFQSFSLTLSVFPHNVNL